MNIPDRAWQFWRDAFAVNGSVTLDVLRRILAFGGFATLVCVTDRLTHHRPELEVAVAPYEVAGAALGLLLVLRTNAGYERWWEGRKLWGGMVNRCRHLAVVALAYGPADPAWRQRVIRLVAAFPHAARQGLRGERTLPEVAALLGEEEAARIAAARHMPAAVILAIGGHLRAALDRSGMDRAAFIQADRDLVELLDYVGGCERIRKTPLPRAYVVQIRRFIVLFLAALPFALLKKIEWLTPLVTMFVAYPILALDEIGDALQDPFSPRALNHLPLDDICRTVEGDLMGMASAAGPDGAPPRIARGVDLGRAGESSEEQAGMVT